MWILIIILVSFGLILMITTYLNRRNKTEETEIKVNNDGECCGAHSVCDRDTLLNSGTTVEYFDDEELDTLAHIPASELTPEQINQLSEIFFTLNEKDVAPWLRSLQIRNIQLPIEIREQALLIVSERRMQ
jgi:hypothetical protein